MKIGLSMIVMLNFSVTAIAEEKITSADLLGRWATEKYIDSKGVAQDWASDVFIKFDKSGEYLEAADQDWTRRSYVVDNGRLLFKEDKRLLQWKILSKNSDRLAVVNSANETLHLVRTKLSEEKQSELTGVRQYRGFVCSNFNCEFKWQTRTADIDYDSVCYDLKEGSRYKECRQEVVREFRYRCESAKKINNAIWKDVYCKAVKEYRP